jgi:uncharacterized protein YdcH (DUF465 family)
MQDHHMLFPIKSGEFMTLIQKEFKTKNGHSAEIFQNHFKVNQLIMKINSKQIY